MPRSQILFGLIHLTAPIQCLILIEPLPQLPRNLGPRKLHTEIKRMAAIIFDLQLRIQGKRIDFDVVTIAVINMNPFG